MAKKKKIFTYSDIVHRHVLICHHHYQQAVRVLKSSNVWKNNLFVSQWLTGTWLNKPEVSFNVCSVYHAAVETNNGTEALNRVLKYKYPGAAEPLRPVRPWPDQY